ncbi:uncharacterized protein ASPGLDRAFT_31918 [Aspergillus glaucus CBS 516.65]|uniref:Uncharacterized protein n=1 Tax=Aspergillus glaucus CBS 516.65 TaxID=1160497 RepID=A0A1L9VY14_ASPGL|nr:hypothetical protein ASPGLDRAFT_31918 [Aspergillus glaucus CBS 516.65]OJJ88810.1 hypothetical protein ASPGLDRAFT_31918 [Aspergillus glaucus CBS 516.65]
MGNNGQFNSQYSQSTINKSTSDQCLVNHSNGSRTSMVPSDGPAALTGKQNPSPKSHSSNVSRLQEDIAGIGSWTDSTPDLQIAMEFDLVLEVNQGS